MVNDLDEPLDLIFAALSDPSRRAIVTRLTRGPATVSEIARPLPMSLPASSKHIKILEGAGLVTRTRSGRVHTLSLNTDAFTAAEEWMNQQRQFWLMQFASLDRFLERKEEESMNG